MFTIKSVSSDGTYYLVSNWRKNKALWVTESKLKPCMLFKTESGAKASLTSLLKVMPEYADDELTIVEF